MGVRSSRLRRSAAAGSSGPTSTGPASTALTSSESYLLVKPSSNSYQVSSSNIRRGPSRVRPIVDERDKKSSYHMTRQIRLAKKRSERAPAEAPGTEGDVTTASPHNSTNHVAAQPSFSGTKVSGLSRALVRRHTSSHSVVEDTSASRIELWRREAAGAGEEETSESERDSLVSASSSISQKDLLSVLERTRVSLRAIRLASSAEEKDQLIDLMREALMFDIRHVKSAKAAGKE